MLDKSNFSPVVVSPRQDVEKIYVAVNKETGEYTGTGYYDDALSDAEANNADELQEIDDEIEQKESELEEADDEEKEIIKKEIETLTETRDSLVDSPNWEKMNAVEAEAYTEGPVYIVREDLDETLEDLDS